MPPLPTEKGNPCPCPTPHLAGGLSHTSLPWGPCQPLSSCPGCSPLGVLPEPPHPVAIAGTTVRLLAAVKAPPLPLCCLFPTGALGRRPSPSLLPAFPRCSSVPSCPSLNSH